MIIGQASSTLAAPRHLSRLETVCYTYDLLLVIGLAGLLPGLLLVPVPLVVRLPLGLAAVLFMPGHVLVAALFPRHSDLDGIARAALALGFSIAVLPVVTLALNVLPWGIRPLPIAFALSAYGLLFSVIALLRRRRAARLGVSYMPPAIHPLGWWDRQSRPVRRFYIAVILALAGLLTGASLTIFAPDPTGRMTEFYALGPDGLAQNYPRDLVPGQDMQVQLGIRNHEGATAHYWVEVRAGGEILAQTEPVILENGATWEGPVRCSLTQPGDNQRIDILLFYQDDSKPYRQLQLWVNVRTSPRADRDVAN